MTITVLLDLYLRDESVSNAPAVLRDILAGTRAFDGCLGVEVLEDAADSSHLVLLEKWVSIERDTAYREWRAGDGATDLGSVLAAPPTLSRFDSRLDI